MTAPFTDLFRLDDINTTRASASRVAALATDLIERGRDVKLASTEYGRLRVRTTVGGQNSQDKRLSTLAFAVGAVGAAIVALAVTIAAGRGTF
jgi:hypothetical protein